MKKLKSIVLAVIVGVIMFSGILYTAFLYINTSSVYGRERKVISNQIKELLESRANIMVSDRTILHENYFKSKYANVVEERQRNQIVKFRDKMKESGETETETGYDAEHEFILEKDGKVWRIVEDRQSEPIGLLSLRDAEKYVYSK